MAAELPQGRNAAVDEADVIEGGVDAQAAEGEAPKSRSVFTLSLF